MENKDGFTFYASFYEALQDLKEKDRVQVYDAICELALKGNDTTNLKGLPKTIFTLIRPLLISNNKKYENGRKGSEYGKLGGRPKKASGVKQNENVKTPMGLLENNPKGLNEITPNNISSSSNSNNNLSILLNDTKRKENTKEKRRDLAEIVKQTRQLNLISLTEQAFGRPLSPVEFKVIDDSWEDTEATRYAIIQAALNNVKTIRYVEGILKSYKSNGIKTLEQALEQEKNFKNKSSSTSNIPEKKYDTTTIHEIDGMKYRLTENGDKMFL